MKIHCTFVETIGKMKFRSKEFSKAVKTKRLISQPIDLRSLADMLGIAHATISRVENGSTPDLKTYCALCAWLGVKADKYLR